MTLIKRMVILGYGMLAGMVLAGPAPVSDAEQATWVQYLLPLPHEITIARAVTVRPSEVALLIDTNAGPVQAQIHAELAGWFQTTAGATPTGAVFQIVMGLLDGDGMVGGQAVADAARLDACPNRTQAYLIQPAGDNRLIVAALHERGLYYGAQTLKQLLAPGLAKESVRIPLAVVTDWPDMEERGIWNSARVAPYLAGLKLNYLTYKCTHANTTNAWPRPVMDTKVMDLLRRHAMVGRVQMLHHLNYFDRLYGLYKYHPELMGQGDEAVCVGEHFKYAQRDIPVICASQPLWRMIVADMLAALGEQGAPEVSVWLSEFKGQCQCPQCRDSSQTLLESRLVVDAWRSIRDQYPDMILRIFYSQGDASAATEQALVELPPEVKIERVYAIYKPFLDAARRGQWVLSFSGYDMCLASPDNCFRTPEKIIAPITNGFHAGLKGVLSVSYHYHGKGMLPAGYYADVYSFPISALAEWSWNVNGRTPRQFMEAWAARTGHADPARFADWVERISVLKAALDKPRVPGAGLPKTGGFRNQFAKIGELIQTRQVIGLYDPAVLTAATEQCRAAETLAASFDLPAPLAETRYFLGLLRMYATLNELSACIAGDPSTPVDPVKLRAAWETYQTSVDAALAANDRRMALWRGEPADYVLQAQKELRDQWAEVRQAMDAAITKILDQ